MIEEMMRKAMQEGQKQAEEAKPTIQAMWQQDEGVSATNASIDFTYNQVLQYVLELTTPGESQVAAAKGLREACLATKAALREEFKNEKFPTASWFKVLRGLQTPKGCDCA